MRLDFVVFVVNGLSALTGIDPDDLVESMLMNIFYVGLLHIVEKKDFKISLVGMLVDQIPDMIGWKSLLHFTNFRFS